MSDGKVVIDTRVNTSGAEKGMKGLATSLTKVGKLMAAAFSIKAIMDFGKKSIDLASDIIEVQNVVDTSFKEMSYKMEQFADTCIEQFGMSKLSAKQMGSTFMAMASGMGQGLDTASDMAVEITGRLGDISSFYNKTIEEVMTIGKAVYSGETEPLKNIGVIMTETQLSAYALANGFTKSYKAMSAQEKLLVRQKYFLEQTKLAAGDFVKTQDSWANQTKILSERWKDFMSIIGSFLITALTPVVSVLNQIVTALINMGNALTNVMAKLGINIQNAKSAKTAYTSLAESAEEYGSAAEEAGDKAKNSTSSLDELNVISKESGGGGGGGGGSAADILDTEDLITNVEEAEDITMPWLDTLYKRLEELKKLFSKGFFDGFGGDLSKLTDRIKNVINKIKNIGEVLKDIFTDSDVITSFNNMIDTMVYNFGMTVGAWLSIGITIAENVIGGIEKYLTNNTERIKQYLIQLFDINAEIDTLQALATSALANIFSVFGDENGQQITADLIGIFADAFMGIQLLLSKVSRDIIQLIDKPIIDNQEKIKKVLDDVLGTISRVTSAIKKYIDDLMDKINQFYDQYIKPFVDDVTEDLTYLVSVYLDCWNTYIQPIIDLLAQRLDELLNQHLSPMFASFLEAMGTVIELLRMFWNEVLIPLIAWLMENIIPVVQPIILTIIEVVSSMAEIITDIIASFFEYVGVVVEGITEVLNGLIEFLVGVFTGDWEKAWKGVTDIFQGVSDMIKGIINVILGAVEKLCNGVIRGINKVIDALNSLSFDIPDWIPGDLGGKSFGINISRLSEISIPRLASGAVIPPNKEFMAILGDQSNGTNIEAPLSTIQDAVANVLEPYLRTLIDNTNTLISSNEEIAKKELAIGDREIARANNRGQQLLGRVILD